MIAMRSPMRAASSVFTAIAKYARALKGMWSRHSMTYVRVLDRDKSVGVSCLEK